MSIDNHIISDTDMPGSYNILIDSLRKYFPNDKFEFGRGDRLLINGNTLKGFIFTDWQTPEIQFQGLIKEIPLQFPTVKSK